MIKNIVFLLIIVTFSSLIHAQQDQWLVEFELPNVGRLSTSMDMKLTDSSFLAYSRKNAAQEVLGEINYMFGKIFTPYFNPQGSLLYARGEAMLIRDNPDSISIKGTLNSPLGVFQLEGIIAHQQLQGFLSIDQDTTSITGHPSPPSFPLNDYPAIFQQLINRTQKYIYDSTLLEGKEWIRFQQKMQALLPRIQTDLELIIAFSHFGKKLPFSHFYLTKEATFEMDAPEKPQLTLVTKNKTAYLDIASFLGTVAEIDSFMAIIKKEDYQHLVVDFRNNGGGSVAPGLAFAQHVVEQTFYGGVLLSRKWFDNHNMLPTVQEYSNFSTFSEANLALLIEDVHKKEGICLKVIPKEQVFSGNLYILTNEYTGSTCEPIVYGLQQIKRATIIGEKTAGAMLSGEFFALQNQFSLFLPTATYYTSDGYKIDKNGVRPDIRVKSINAWKYIKKRLKKNQYN
ncbi:MAG: S41 family peptidase [Aureispira sp.]